MLSTNRPNPRDVADLHQHFEDQRKNASLPPPIYDEKKESASFLDLSDFDNIISKSSKDTEVAKRVGVARRILNSESAYAQLDPRTLKDMKELIWDHEVTREWKPEALVLFVDRVCCQACGSLTKTPEGVYQRQSHRQGAMIDRWVKNLKHSVELPKEVFYRDSSTELCVTCAIGEGWLDV